VHELLVDATNLPDVLVVVIPTAVGLAALGALTLWLRQRKKP